MTIVMIAEHTISTLTERRFADHPQFVLMEVNPFNVFKILVLNTRLSVPRLLSVLLIIVVDVMLTILTHKEMRCANVLLFFVTLHVLMVSRLIRKDVRSVVANPPRNALTERNLLNVFKILVTHKSKHVLLRQDVKPIIVEDAMLITSTLPIQRFVSIAPSLPVQKKSFAVQGEKLIPSQVVPHVSANPLVLR